MYVPKHFAETRPEALRELVRSCPLGMLVTMTAHGLEANHIPFVLKSDPIPYGTLQGHVARANSLWESFDPDVEALIMFQGPQTYISPSWYPTKQEAGKAVPTWNYVVVHAYGKLRVVQDQDWLKNHLEQLTDQQEHGREEPWHLSDAPPEFTGKLMGAITGIEIEISRIVGKWKLGQNRSVEDQTGTMEGLSREADPSALSMANYLKRYQQG